MAASNTILSASAAGTTVLMPNSDNRLALSQSVDNVNSTTIDDEVSNSKWIFFPHQLIVLCASFLIRQKAVQEFTCAMYIVYQYAVRLS